MKSFFPEQSVWHKLKPVILNLGLLIFGSILSAVAIKGILIPQQFVSGGFLGLALVIHYLNDVVPLGVLYLLLNIPLFTLGWLFVGRRFFFYSIVGMLIFSGAVEWVDVTIQLQDKLLSALLAGIIMGLGAGIILKSLGSSGGMDILSVILLQRFSIRLGTSTITFNVIVLMATALLFSLEGALYTLIYMYVSAQIVDLVVTGLSQRKAVFIISAFWEKISPRILKDIHRGMTILHGQGGYSGEEQKILYTIVTFRELATLKEIIRREDPNAFVVVTDTAEVMGYRIGNQPHW
jgi:uncharacterized membrane-anchored protein YitT (DUF2179 family)